MPACKLTVEWAEDNAAFGDFPGDTNEREKVLSRMLANLDAGQYGGELFDSNGNSIGEYELVELPDGE